MSKKNIFNIKVSKIVLSITKRIESFFNYYKYSKSNKKKDLNFWNTPLDKKIFIFSGIIFIVITYFLLPAFYDKNEIKNQLKNQISKKYNLDVKLDKNPKYGVFPKPHFLVEDAKIKFDSEVISNSKYIKFFFSSKNNFIFNKINLDDLVFIETDFKIDKKNFSFFLDLLNNKTTNQDIKFVKNKLFYLDHNDNIIFFSDLKKLNYLYQENFINEVESKLEIFNLPVNLNTKHDIINQNINSNINLNSLKLKIENKLNYNNDYLEGELDLSYINKKNQTIKYTLENNDLNFNTIDKKLIGEINIKPFYLKSRLNLRNISLNRVFAKNSALINLLKSEILNNKNLNGRVKVEIDSLNDFKHLSKINFDIKFEEGLIFVKNLNFIFKDSVKFKLNEVNLIVEENKLKLIGDIVLDFKNIESFYYHFQIIRNYRKNINQITSNFVFNFDDGLLEFNELKIKGVDRQIIEQFLNKFNLEKKDLFNKVTFRNIVRDFFKTISSG